MEDLFLCSMISITIILGLISLGYWIGARRMSATIYNALSAEVDLTKIPIKGRRTSEAMIKIVHNHGKLVDIILKASSTKTATVTEDQIKEWEAKTITEEQIKEENDEK